MAKSKSEPRAKRTKGTAAPQPDGVAKAGPGAGAEDEGADLRPDSDAAPRPAAKRRARSTAKEGGRARGGEAQPAASKEGGRARGGEAQPAESDDEGPREDDEADGAPESGAARTGDVDEGDVVEVVGEVIDDAGVDLNDIELPRSARASGGEGRGSGDVALSRTDPLQAYLREVQRHALLTPDEEKELTIKYTKTQDVATAARLVTANLRLVVKLAYEYRRAYKNIMDLIQEGNIGLMQAVKRYDPYRGVKLSSYAAWWIRAYILRFILNNWRLVKLGTTQAQRKLFFNLNKEKAKLSAMGIEPTAAEIAKRLSVEEKEVVDMDRRLASGEASLDAPVGDLEGRTIPRVELLVSSGASPDTAFEASEMGMLVHDRLSKFRETLKGKDVIIFDKRMAAEDPLTLQELGNEFGISRERVRQLEARLQSKLRTYLQEELGDAVEMD
ncbi:RNA polymerase sigma factor rpoD [Sorangium cellulosum So ce56]|uniref:RNA polymerase sigma factor rpoD n=1 Tax=Sorangium cellulosum (strain So ce56) TaxID=448385 RepID=A9G9R6_SORC5|nr:RNA polymerase factor sigma-32 [Sorangium cellulosum]CAN99226.1 RNA polymerase sigma factor rpoD [Sorangium cellulosum So ce56]